MNTTVLYLGLEQHIQSIKYPQLSMAYFTEWDITNHNHNLIFRGSKAFYDPIFW